MRSSGALQQRLPAALAGAGVAVVLAGCARAPAIVASPAVVDLGRVAQYAPAAGVCRVVNLGRHPVRVSWVQPSCGCTESRLASLTLVPRRPTPLFVAFDSGAYAGNVQKSVTIHFEGGLPDLLIPIRASVYREIMVTGTSLDFGAVRLGGAKELQFELARVVAGGLPIPRVSATPQFDAQALRLGASRVRVVVTAHPVYSTGRRQGRLHIDTGLRRPAVLDIPLSAEA